eukprot:CAMPEP_0170471746 /NCGR_PEP_ID=MMETSP0123-20130129/13915_2 /TAXON_ID=182087 /ORGANISM="Favella ehrenbergii, Strain Fehren 1" /LENGTH=100 /DNA_ID=CAMNT_0010739601 /DNA_START=527 /DNA_END=829 /DNA_ORIENTATION=-
MAHWAEQFDTTITLLLCAHDTVHETLIIDAVSQAELMADLVSHDMTPSHQEVLLAIWIFNAIEFGVVAAEREGADTLREAGPTEAERPAWLRVQVFHRQE